MPPRRINGKRLVKGTHTTRPDPDRSIIDGWQWVLNLVQSVEEINDEHCLLACGLRARKCPNLFARPDDIEEERPKKRQKLVDDDDIDIMNVESEDEETPMPCSKKRCKNNPNCLNYLGQHKWENEASALAAFLRARGLPPDPSVKTRKPKAPVGLKNLGATCYANALIQVWFHNPSFVQGVYSCATVPSLHPSDVTSISEPVLSSVTKMANEGKPESDEIIVTRKASSPLHELQITFAALQLSRLATFNPIGLVDSLELRTGEEQDVQEFSKLFMTLLANEFDKQEDKSLHEFVSRQFGGKRVYGTRCHTCSNVSEREEEFWELEVTLKDGDTLEQRIAKSLESEVLDDDNKYACSTCDSLQPATRFVKLRAPLPPVLHISLLRFVFDMKTLEKKKAKTNARYPLSLNMKPFINPDDVEARGNPSTDMIYDLRGVLLHKGTSAHHGHYECQVWSAEDGDWYQYNDEKVTKLGKKPLQSISKPPPQANASSARLGSRSRGKGKATTRGRTRRIVQSRTPSPATIDRTFDDENANGSDIVEIVDEVPDVPKIADLGKAMKPEKEDPNIDSVITLPWLNDQDQQSSTMHGMVEEVRMDVDEAQSLTHHSLDTSAGSYMSSKDAYMLVYVRRDPDGTSIPSTLPNGSTLKPRPSPPPNVVTEIEEANAKHEEQCNSYNNLLDEYKADFSKIRSAKQQVYRTWDIQDSNDISLVVASAVLEQWLESELFYSEPAVAIVPKQSSEDEGLSTEDLNEGRHPTSQSTGRSRAFDNSSIACEHGKVDPAKGDKMKQVRARSINFSIFPRFLSTDICRICISETFRGKALRIRHNRLVDLFEGLLSQEDSSPGAWVSKRWVKCWTSKISDKEPATERHSILEKEYTSDVLCNHGLLQPNTSNRRIINGGACAILKDTFPDWRPLAEDTAVCVSCQTDRNEEIADVERQVNEEREHLERVLLNAYLPSAAESLVELANKKQAVLAMVPKAFVVQWKRWIKHPFTHPRPSSLNNDVFLCEHGLLSMTPTEMLEVDLDFVLVGLPGWNSIQNFYSAHPLIAIYPSEDERHLQTPSTCDECNFKRKIDFENTSITVLLVRKPAGTKEQTSTGSTGDLDTIEECSSAAQSERRSARISRSTRGVSGRTIVKVSKGDTVHDVKLKLSAIFNLLASAQRLFYRGVELMDDKATMQDIQLVAGSVLHTQVDAVEEAEEVEETTLELGFTGTVLHDTRPHPLNNGVKASPSTDSCPEGTLKDTTTCDTCFSEQNGHLKPSPQTNGISDSRDTTSLPCSSCTFLNSPGAVLCEMCENPV